MLPTTRPNPDMFGRIKRVARKPPLRIAPNDILPFLKSLANEILNAAIHYRLYLDLNEATKEYVDYMNITPAFWGLTHVLNAVKRDWDEMVKQDANEAAAINAEIAANAATKLAKKESNEKA